MINVKIKFFIRQVVPYGPKLPDFEKGMIIGMKTKNKQILIQTN